MAVPRFARATSAYFHKASWIAVSRLYDAVSVPCGCVLNPVTPTSRPNVALVTSLPYACRAALYDPTAATCAHRNLWNSRDAASAAA